MRRTGPGLDTADAERIIELVHWLIRPTWRTRMVTWPPRAPRARPTQPPQPPRAPAPSRTLSPRPRPGAS